MVSSMWLLFSSCHNLSTLFSLGNISLPVKIFTSFRLTCKCSNNSNKYLLSFSWDSISILVLNSCTMLDLKKNKNH